jgi:hypothetical protein
VPFVVLTQAFNANVLTTGCDADPGGDALSFRVTDAEHEWHSQPEQLAGKLRTVTQIMCCFRLCSHSFVVSLAVPGRDSYADSQCRLVAVSGGLGVGSGPGTGGLRVWSDPGTGGLGEWSGPGTGGLGVLSVPESGGLGLCLKPVLTVPHQLAVRLA